MFRFYPIFQTALIVFLITIGIVLFFPPAAAAFSGPSDPYWFYGIPKSNLNFFIRLQSILSPIWMGMYIIEWESCPKEKLPVDR